MKYRSVGNSGLKVSEIALGSWMTQLTSADQEKVAADTVRAALDAGINFFDCADAYSGGEAERFLGKALKDVPREEYVVSSKVFFPTGRDVNQRGLSRKHIRENIDRTLKNMGVDYIDLYYCHRFDTTTPWRRRSGPLAILSPKARSSITESVRSGAQPVSRRRRRSSIVTICIL